MGLPAAPPDLQIAIHDGHAPVERLLLKLEPGMGLQQPVHQKAPQREGAPHPTRLLLIAPISKCGGGLLMPAPNRATPFAVPALRSPAHPACATADLRLLGPRMVAPAPPLGLRLEDTRPIGCRPELFFFVRPASPTPQPSRKVLWELQFFFVRAREEGSEAVAAHE